MEKIQVEPTKESATCENFCSISCQIWNKNVTSAWAQHQITFIHGVNEFQCLPKVLYRIQT